MRCASASFYFSLFNRKLSASCAAHTSQTVWRYKVCFLFSLCHFLTKIKARAREKLTELSKFLFVSKVVPAFVQHFLASFAA